MTRGISFGVSIGPGDKNKITIEAVSVIQDADIIFLPSFPKEDCKAYQIIKEIMPNIDEKEICAETFTMSRDSNVMAKRHAEIVENAKAFLDNGKSIAFLTLGDVSLYSTYLYIHRQLIEDGYKSVLISGISSVSAAASRLGIALALGTEELHIFPNADNLHTKLNYDGTKVFMKTRKDLESVIEKIVDYINKNPQYMACGISNCGMDGEIVAKNTNELSLLNGYFTIIIVKQSC